MRKSLFAIALAALMGFARPAAAQHISVSLRLGDTSDTAHRIS
jgi:hypothetical protein